MKLKYNRKPNHLPEYDYSQPGYYFVTICAKNMEECFGRVRKEKFIPMTTGLVVNWHWKQISQHFPNVGIDEYQVMPNHIHGIVVIDENNQSDKNETPRQMLIPRIIGSFKKYTSRQIRAEVQPDFRWQRSYYDHVIRNEESLEMIREYILSNPKNWERDHNRIDDNPFI